MSDLTPSNISNSSFDTKRSESYTPVTEELLSPGCPESTTDDTKSTSDTVHEDLVWHTAKYVIETTPYHYQVESLVPITAAPQRIATRLWSLDAEGIHIAYGTIFVIGHGVRPQSEAFLHLVLGRHVYNVFWQAVTVDSLEREVDPDRELDPIILRQRLWENVPADAWWSHDQNGPKQPAMDVDMISNYYAQRRGSLCCGPSVAGLGVYESSSGAQVLLQKRQAETKTKTKSKATMIGLAADDEGYLSDSSFVTNPYDLPPVSKDLKKRSKGRQHRRPKAALAAEHHPDLVSEQGHAGLNGVP